MTEPMETRMVELRDASLAAERLRADPAFQRAILALRKDAVEALVGVDPDDGATIRSEQARIRAIDALCDELATVIMRGAVRVGAVVA